MRRGKYGNTKTEVDGIRFDSKKEAARYLQLRLLLKAHVIRDLRLQVPYRLEVGGVLICTYKADFVYLEKGAGRKWLEVVEDVKGVRTRDYVIKKKLMWALHKIAIVES